MNESAIDQYQRVRALTLDLCRTLEAEDTVVQTMPDVSPMRAGSF